MHPYDPRVITHATAAHIPEVLAEWERARSAAAMVEAGHEQLRAAGVFRVTALVGTGEDVATGFWAAAGYEWDDHIARFVQNIGERR